MVFFVIKGKSLFIIGLIFFSKLSADNSVDSHLITKTNHIYQLPAKEAPLAEQKHDLSDITTSLSHKKNVIHQLKTFTPKTSFFFQANIGVGFLYFSDIQGNVVVRYEIPSITETQEFFQGPAPFQGPIRYNRTPLFEYLLGYQWAPWIKGAFSYQYQGGVSIQTPMIANTQNDPTFFISENPYSQLRSNLSLNAIMGKVIFESPWAFVIRNMAINPYLSAGIGASWQSWTNISLQQTVIMDNFFSSLQLPIRNKYMANATWMVDAGLHLQSALPQKTFSIFLGCKYIEWGQARNIGKISQQNNPKRGLVHPFKIKTIYSFAPYLAAQWNFSNTYTGTSPYRIANKDINRWKPFFIHSHCIERQPSILTQFNAGIGFLYFSDINGNTQASYSDPGTGTGGLTSDQAALQGFSPFKGSLRYNRTPVFEYILAYQWNPWIKGGISYQHQGGISIQTSMEKGINSTPNFQGRGGSSNPWSQLRFNLSLDALLAKIYFQLPYSFVSKGVAVSPYLAAGCGGGWQSCTNVELEQTLLFTNSNPYINSVLPLRNKYVSNAVYMIDTGFQLRSVYPNQYFSVLLGCKYNQWGQIRNLGKVSQQNEPKRGLAHPFRAKTIYSFVPYLAVQWNFSNTYQSKSPYLIGNKKVNQWKPFVTSIGKLQKKSSVFTQFNTGVSFLYFSGIRGNLHIQYELPAITATQDPISGESPFKGRLRYNRVPLFEYLLGYEWRSWFSIALSYQYQGTTSLQSAMEKALNVRPNIGFNINSYSQFRSNLRLDALMLKFNLKWPFPLICKAVATTPYLAAGIGSSWQSWTNIMIEQNSVSAPFFNTFSVPLRNKYSANAVWMLDLGMCMQSAYPCNSFSVFLGCKYIEWGQARNIGKISQQNEPKRGLNDPFRIKTIYSFAPYLGVQWNF